MKYACVKQYDKTDCGAAVLATICKHYGRRTTISRLREAAGTDNIGINLTGIVKAATKLGFDASAVKGDAEALFEDIPLPAIAHIVTDKGLLHYVVIHKITQEFIIIADPAVGIVKKSVKDFCAMWTGVLVILTATERFKQGTDTQSISQQFFSIIKPHWRLLLGIFLFSAIYMCLGFVGTYYFRIIIDNVVPSGNAQLLHTVSFCVITAYIFLVLDMSLLYGFYSHVLKLPMSFFDTRKNGEIISRFNDAVHMRDAISNAAVSMVMDTVMAIVGGILLFTQDAHMFGVAVIIVVIYALLVLVFNKPYEEQNRKSMENSALSTSYVVESLNGVQTVKSHGYEEKARRTVKDKLACLLQSSFKLGVISNKQETMKRAAELIGTTIVIWLGASRVMGGDISLGGLISFYALLAYFLNPIKNLIDLQPQIQTAVVAAQRLSDIMELDGEHYAPATIGHLQGDIEFKNVTFRYGMRNPVLKDVSFKIKQGQCVAFVGESGAGKSTIAK